MLLGYSFEPRPTTRALGTAGSVMTIGSSINGRSHSNKPVRKFGLRRLQRRHVIQAEPSFFLSPAMF